MPPKKKEEAKPKPLIGRVGTNLKMGIVGLPNAGKSTFFNILTKSSVPAENFPFCTINPNESRVPVPDERFDFLCHHYEPLSKQPAYLNVVDIAGLVKGASEGQGLGNAFLSHIKACDGIFHMVRLFDEVDIAHVEGNIDPIRDIEIIHDELRLKDLEICKKTSEDLEKKVVRGNDKTLKGDYEIINKVLHVLNEEKGSIRFHDWHEKEIEVLNKYLFNTSKPMIYLLNMSEEDYIKKKNKWLGKVKQWIDEHDPGATVIPFSANYEYRLVDLPTEEKEKLIQETGASSALEKIILAGYRALQLCYFFTCGKDEVKAWTIQVGTKAPHAAGRIHTDFEKGFIMAEVMKYEDFKEFGNENAVKAEGKYRQQGKNYTVEDGDIIYFKVNAGAGLSAAKNNMSWNPEGFFDPSSYNQQYTGPTSYELQQQQQQQQQQHYAPQQQQQLPYPGGSFMPSQYNINTQAHPNQFYRPEDYLPSAPNPTDNDNEELPLLEELGINFDHIFKKTKSVLNPFSTPDSSILDDVDLAGPLVFCLAFACSLLLLGKIHFGYVYGIVTLGTVGMYGLLNMMTSPDKPCSGLFVTSVLGYCLLPMVILAFSSFLFQLNGLIGLLIASIFILWCSLSASKLFATSLAMIGQQILVAYPCALFYGVFALLTIF